VVSHELEPLGHQRPGDNRAAGVDGDAVLADRFAERCRGELRREGGGGLRRVEIERLVERVHALDDGIDVAVMERADRDAT
jgi:hypothetical protein